MIVSGMPKRVIQEKTKACAHAATEISESGMASIHLDVLSMMEVSKPSLRDGDGLRQEAGVVVDLALLAVQVGSRPVGDVLGEPAPYKSRRNRAPEFCWDNGVEDPS
jgi:hypothetical protein